MPVLGSLPFESAPQLGLLTAVKQILTWIIPRCHALTLVFLVILNPIKITMLAITIRNSLSQEC